DGRTYTAPLELKLDPRVKTPLLALRQQLTLETLIAKAMWNSYQSVRQVRDLRAQLKQLQVKLEDDSDAKAALDAVAALDKKAAELLAVAQTWPPVGVVSVAAL